MNAEANKHYTEYKRLCALQDAEIERNWNIFKQYSDMEGKYGKYVYDSYQAQGYRGYYYEYPSDEVRRQEEQERAQFLKDNNWRQDTDIRREYEPKINAEWDAYCLARYGMTAKQRKLEQKLNSYLRDLEKAKQEVALCESLIKKTRNEIEKEKRGG